MTSVEKRVNDWIAAANERIESNNELIKWAADTESPGSQWQMSQNAAIDAAADNDFLREGLWLLKSAIGLANTMLPLTTGKRSR